MHRQSSTPCPLFLLAAQQGVITFPASCKCTIAYQGQGAGCTGDPRANGHNLLPLPMRSPMRLLPGNTHYTHMRAHAIPITSLFVLAYVRYRGALAGIVAAVLLAAAAVLDGQVSLADYAGNWFAGAAADAPAILANRGAEHFKCSADANGNRPKCNAELCCGRAKKDNSIGITMSVDVCFKRTAQSYGVKNADGQMELWTFACIDSATKIAAAAIGALSLSYMLA